MDARAFAIAAVERQLAEYENSSAAVAAGLSRRGNRRMTGGSVPYTIRLDPGEVDALERRAAKLGLGPTVLARNLIRTGLREPGDARLAAAIEQVDCAVAELRALAG